MTNNTRKRLTRRIFASLALAFFCWQLPAAAQENLTSPDGPQWYQVELLIFERQQGGNTGPDVESWPRNVALAYPPNVQHLVDPDGENEANSGTLDNVDQEQPFILLERDQLQLTDSARGIQRDSGLRVLFHQAWRQPMVPFEQAPAIIVSGGEKVDEHHELEGSVTFSVSRYLHMHTNLWLTEFETNYGQAIGQWPPLPKQPPKPGELTDDDGLSVDLRLQDPQPVLNPWNSTGTTYNANDTDYNLGQRNDTLQLNNYGYLSQQPFVTKNIVALQQQRRMRSDELHYVDHPRLGILVRIKNYDPKAATNTVQ